MSTATLKRSASLAFAQDRVATTPSSPQTRMPYSSPLKRRVNGHLRSLSVPKRLSLAKSSPLPSRNTTTLRRAVTFHAPNHPFDTLMSPRPAKRQKLLSSDDEDSDIDEWQMVIGPSNPSAQPTINQAVVPATGTGISTIVPTNHRNNAGSRVLHNLLLDATSRIMASVGLGIPVGDSVPHLPPVMEIEEEPEQEDVDMEIIVKDEIYEIDRMETRSATVSPSFPPPPVPGYTPEQWALLSRYPHLVKGVLSSQAKEKRDSHARHAASNYNLAANPRYHQAVARRSSPLATTTPIQRQPHFKQRLYPMACIVKTITLAQAPAALPSRWKHFPTCTGIKPAPEPTASPLRNTLLVNFGRWLRANHFWMTIQTGGLRQAVEWYNTCGMEDDGMVTPDVQSPVAPSYSFFGNPTIR
jgi:hypothetical protein